MYKREWKEGKRCFVEAAVEVVVHIEMEVCGGYGYEGDGYGGEYSGGREVEVAVDTGLEVVDTKVDTKVVDMEVDT
ncbi:hypothetical protein DY000_02016313 [Brassica cretica]|uniref:Uncharacterized protein n=1 Tax=Brassica cretica TaxID=69181 RepID=A0ABQ7CQQ5_BRACR|nr:hypothetical protein DY000_02016313 [Brassica cretica]